MATSPAPLGRRRRRAPTERSAFFGAFFFILGRWTAPSLSRPRARTRDPRRKTRAFRKHWRSGLIEAWPEMIDGSASSTREALKPSKFKTSLEGKQKDPFPISGGGGGDDTHRTGAGAHSQTVGVAQVEGLRVFDAAGSECGVEGDSSSKVGQAFTAAKELEAHIETIVRKALLRDEIAALQSSAPRRPCLQARRVCVLAHGDNVVECRPTMSFVLEDSAGAVSLVLIHVEDHMLVPDVLSDAIQVRMRLRHIDVTQDVPLPLDPRANTLAVDKLRGGCTKARTKNVEHVRNVSRSMLAIGAGERMRASLLKTILAVLQRVEQVERPPGPVWSNKARQDKFWLSLACIPVTHTATWSAFFDAFNCALFFAFFCAFFCAFCQAALPFSFAACCLSAFSSKKIAFTKTSRTRRRRRAGALDVEMGAVGVVGALPQLVAQFVDARLSSHPPPTAGTFRCPARCVCVRLTSHLCALPRCDRSRSRSSRLASRCDRSATRFCSGSSREERFSRSLRPSGTALCHTAASTPRQRQASSPCEETEANGLPTCCTRLASRGTVQHEDLFLTHDDGDACREGVETAGMSVCHRLGPCRASTNASRPLSLRRTPDCSRYSARRVRAGTAHPCRPCLSRRVDGHVLENCASRLGRLCRPPTLTHGRKSRWISSSLAPREPRRSSREVARCGNSTTS